MVNAKAMENSGIQVMHMDPILCGKIPELISSTMDTVSYTHLTLPTKA